MPRRSSRGQPLPGLLHKHTAAKLSAAYRKQWGQDWPHDDRYLKQLWDETKTKTDRVHERHQLVQMAMRECDTTIPADYGSPPADSVAEPIDCEHKGAGDV